MKTNLKFWPAIISVLSSAALLAAEPMASNAMPSQNRPLQAINMVQPVFPQSLSQVGIYEGSAKIIFTVDNTGKLTDALLLEATHPAFGKVAISALKESIFAPALLNGEPQAVVKEATYNFKEGAPLTMAIVDTDYLRKTFPENPDKYAYRISSARELDKIPVPLKTVSPFPSKKIDEGKTEKVTVEFFIDEKGQVRIPLVKTATDADLGYAAVEAIAQWQFEPPLRDGKPVVIRVEQTFELASRKKG